MLSLSADVTESEVDLRAVNGEPSADIGAIEYGELLSGFATAFATRDETALADARSALQRGAGDVVLTEAAGVAANFQRMVRIADTTGIPLDERNVALSHSLLKDLELDRFESARNTPKPGLKMKLLSLLAGPMAKQMVKKIRARNQ